MSTDWLITAGVFVASMVGVVLFLRRKDKANRGDPTIRAVAVITMGLAIASTFQIIWFQYQRDREQKEASHKADCQARINTAILSTLKDRSGPNASADDALVGMVNAILNAHSAAETRAALINFIKAMDEKKKAQANSPLPDIPADCKP